VHGYCPPPALRSSSRTRINTLPNKLRPCHCLGSCARESSTANPIPHTLSRGLASTNVLLPVANSFSTGSRVNSTYQFSSDFWRKGRLVIPLSSGFWENFATLPLNTISSHCVSHRSCLNPFTFLPKFFWSLGLGWVRIFLNTSSSPNNLAFPAIMNCSAQLNS